MPRAPYLLVFTIIALGVVAPASAERPPADEMVIVSGGVALREWEEFRREADRHDRWWGNFIRPARIRFQQIRETSGERDVFITWLVHRPSYITRADEDGRPLLSFIESVRDAYGVNLVWYETTEDFINYINKGQNRRRTKVNHFEYFGHSNKFCMMFEYSNEILGSSTAFLHVRDLDRLSRRAFRRGAYAKSWGCHTGEAMSEAWQWHLGFPLIGAVGKTDYTPISSGLPPRLSPGGSWVR